MAQTALLVARCTDEHSPLHCARLEALYEKDREITAETFFRHVSLKAVSSELGYAFGAQKGLHLKQDYHVRYHRSQWRGVPCFHMDWSAIDHIYVQPAHQPQMTDMAIYS